MFVFVYIYIYIMWYDVGLFCFMSFCMILDYIIIGHHVVVCFLFFHVVFSVYHPIFSLSWWHIRHCGLSVGSLLFLNHAHELHVRIGNKEKHNWMHCRIHSHDWVWGFGKSIHGLAVEDLFLGLLAQTKLARTFSAALSTGHPRWTLRTSCWYVTWPVLQPWKGGDIQAA